MAQVIQSSQEDNQSCTRFAERPGVQNPVPAERVRCVLRARVDSNPEALGANPDQVDVVRSTRRIVQSPHLELLFWSATTDPRDLRFMVLDPLVVFVNNLYPVLRSLSVTASRCAANIDLTPLFKGLGAFPH